jgi:hypothetical protein
MAAGSGALFGGIENVDDIIWNIDQSLAQC